MSNEMIERVAKAINCALHNGLNCDMAGCKAQCVKQAKAAIEAMKEPTDEMLDAGAYDLDMTLKQQYERMIDAALDLPDIEKP